MAEFGELETINPSQAWQHEEHDFTPWMEKNLDKLAKEVDLPALDLEGREVREGNLRADLIATVPQDGRRVLIENQLYRGDFEHLGRMLAYASAFKADIVLWVTADFGQEQLAAVRWLNENTSDTVDFFAVQVKVFRIGDSLMAPRFEVLERPNNWVREVRASHKSGELNELQQFRQDFWEFYNQSYPGDLQRWYPGYRNSNVFIRVEGIVVSLYLASWGTGIYLSVRSGNDPDTAGRIRRCYEVLKEKVPERMKNQTPEYSRDKENWEEMAQWFHDRLMAFREIIGLEASGELELSNADGQPTQS